MATFNTISTDIGTNALARAISAFSDQAYTDNVRIAGTALVGSDARLSGSEEDYFGTVRWTRTLGDIAGRAIDGTAATGFATAINVATETSDEGQTTDVRHDSAQYIKTMRTLGAEQFNVTEVLTQAPNAIEKVSRDFGVSRSRDTDAALLAVLRSVAATEAKTGTAGQVITSPRNNAAGFYVDLGTDKLVSASSATNMGAARGNALWEAIGAGFGDQDPEFFYLVISPETYQDIRSANLVDQDSISDGNVNVPTLLGGKFRILVTQNVAGHNFSTAANIDGTKTSYLMMPGFIHESAIAVPNPVAFDADESMGRGAGQRELWYRWGNVYHPQGYTWQGSTSAFAQNTETRLTGASTLLTSFYNTSLVAAAPTSYARKETVGNLGILPIFHA